MKISVVIPSKSMENLVPCVAAVRAYEPSADVRVVWDQEWHPKIDAHVYFGEKPFVFARNVNIGIMKAGEFVDGVVILNDDAILQTPGGFSLLAQAAADHPEYGIIAATTNNVGNPNQQPRGIGLREDPRMVCFVAVYIPRTTIDLVGLLDERFVGYGLDDDDYCLRVRNAGLKIGIHDGCFVDHGSLKSAYRGTGPADFSGNLELFKQKWGMDNWGNPVMSEQCPACKAELWMVDDGRAYYRCGSVVHLRTNEMTIPCDKQEKKCAS